MSISTQNINGKALANTLTLALKADIAQQLHATSTAATPCLAVVLIGSNPASQVYVRHKIKACSDVGIRSILVERPETTTQSELLDTIKQLNLDPTVHGILVQLPLPAHLNAQDVIAAIAVEKDVDGFHAMNAGALSLGLDASTHFQPCTPAGCMLMLASCGIALRGKHAVVLGASNIVGKPMSLLLLQAGCTVTICNSKTPDISVHTKLADIIVIAIGKPKLLKKSMIKPGAILIDVGINRLSDGQLCGDVDEADVQGTAGYISPVPGGVGPMTIAMLLQNTWQAFKQQN